MGSERLRCAFDGQGLRSEALCLEWLGLAVTRERWGRAFVGLRSFWNGSGLRFDGLGSCFDG